MALFEPKGFEMIQDYTSAQMPPQTGKTFFVTGANTGIGFEAAKAIAEKGARVLLGCRNPSAGNDALARIRAAHSDADVALVELDLADLSSVRRAAEVVLTEARLDVLINNAGVMGNPRTLTADGFESQLGINHLGHFALTGLLLPKLLETEQSRVVTVSSLGHRQVDDLPWDDLKAEQSYNPTQRYAVSKLANLLFTYELDRRLRAQNASTIAVAVHPGAADSDLTRHMSSFAKAMLRLTTPILRLFLNSSEQGAWPTELAATHPDVEGGQYFGPGRFAELSGPARQVDSTDASKDASKARRLWELSVQLTSVAPTI